MLLPSFLLEDTAKVELPPRGGRHLRPFWFGCFSHRYLSVAIRGVGRCSSPTPRGKGRAESGRRQKKERGKACCRRDQHLRYNNNVCACKSSRFVVCDIRTWSFTGVLPFVLILNDLQLSHSSQSSKITSYACHLRARTTVSREAGGDYRPILLRGMTYIAPPSELYCSESRPI